MSAANRHAEIGPIPNGCAASRAPDRFLSWSGRVASAGISLNRRSRPGSPVGVSSLGPALKLPGDREESRGGNPVTAGW